MTSNRVQLTTTEEFRRGGGEKALESIFNEVKMTVMISRKGSEPMQREKASVRDKCDNMQTISKNTSESKPLFQPQNTTEAKQEEKSNQLQQQTREGNE